MLHVINMTIIAKELGLKMIQIVKTRQITTEVIWAIQTATRSKIFT